MTTAEDDEFVYTCRVQDRFVLTDGTQIVRRRADYKTVLKCGDLMLHHMDPLVREIAEAHDTDTPIAMHGDEGGARGQFIVPTDSILYAKVEMLDPDGAVIEAEPGHALRDDDDEGGYHRRAALRSVGAVGRPPARNFIVRNVRQRNDPTTS